MFRWDPLIALVAGTLYLGLSTGVGTTGTIAAITAGFGEVVGEIGLLITFSPCPRLVPRAGITAPVPGP